MRLFLDTSAFAKRYIADQSSSKVSKLCEEADSLVISVICLPELVSTLSRLVREKKLVKSEYRKLKEKARADLEDIDVCQITTAVLDSAIPLLEDHPLRAMDALHLSCALAVEADVFVSADHRQLAAAKKSRLKIVDVS